LKNSSWHIVLTTIVAFACLGTFNEGPASAETLKIEGSSGFAADVIGRYQDRIETLAGRKLSLTANTAGAGLVALLSGKADLAMISAPLERVVAALRKSRPDLPFHLLHEFRIGEARVAFPVNPGNPVRSISLAKLKQILGGQIDNWQMIGGPDLAIHVVALRDGGGTRLTTEAMLLDGQSMTPRSAVLVESAQEVVQGVARDRGALGISEASLVNRRRLPELQTKVLIAQSYNLVSLNEPTDAMRAVIAATRSVVFDEEP
jgi:phosphate transport system substrate-binding protein